MSRLSRRNFINYLFGGGLVGTLITFLYPVIRFITPPQQKEAIINTVEAARVGELPPNTFKIFKFGNAPGILIHTAQGELKAFTDICTHLACTVRFHSETETIHCPCHNGRFDLAGNVLSGPPPAPLEEYNIEISADTISVSKRT